MLVAFGIIVATAAVSFGKGDFGDVIFRFLDILFGNGKWQARVQCAVCSVQCG